MSSPRPQHCPFNWKPATSERLISVYSYASISPSFALARAKTPKVGEDVWLHVLGSHTCFYKDEELIA